MRLNLDSTLTSPAVPSLRLVPYTSRHVPTYHAWMEDEGLRAATGSERLSPGAEAAMQAAWAGDEDKLTFIILDTGLLAAAEARGLARVEAEVEAMVGDVNLFLLQEDEDEGEEGGADGPPPSPPPSRPPPPAAVGEVEIMVAVPAARRRGLGAAAVRLLLTYARAHLGLGRVVAKVGRGNAASVRLFTAALGFRVAKEVPVFDEVHLRADLAEGVGGDGDGAHHPALVGGLEEGAYGAWLEGGGGLTSKR